MRTKNNSTYSPSVSIVITSYNRAQWIGKAIESALQQDYPNLEIIISDNCSTDNSEEIIQQYLSDPRIKYSKNKSNIGMIANFEKVFFNLACGNYLIHISSDDYLNHNSFISDSIAIINKYENVLLVFGKYQKLDEKTKQITSIPVPDYYVKEFRTGREAFLDFAKHPYFGWAACLINRNKLIELELHISDNICGDIETNLKLMLHGNAGYVNMNAYTVRMHSQNATGNVLTAKNYIDSRLNMFENLYNLYLLMHGSNIAIKRWRDTILQRDIKTIGIALLLRNNKEYKIFADYIQSKYPEYYKNFKRTNKYLIVRHIFPVIKNKYFKKLARFAFPAKDIFLNESQR